MMKTARDCVALRPGLNLRFGDRTAAQAAFSASRLIRFYVESHRSGKEKREEMLARIRESRYTGSQAGILNLGIDTPGISTAE